MFANCQKLLKANNPAYAIPGKKSYVYIHKSAAKTNKYNRKSVAFLFKLV